MSSNPTDSRGDYFDRVELAMRDALRRRAHVPWYARMARRPARAAIVLVASLAVAGSALAAVGAFRTGTSVAANVPDTPRGYQGVAIPGSVRLLGLRVADPGGGPPWGIRMLRTTRGLLCLQVGRVVGGRLGVLGQDGVFLDDGRFHALSDDYFGPPGCVTPDGRGHGFLDDEVFAVPASGLLDPEPHGAGGCVALGPWRGTPACPADDLRDVYFGLLGPRATSFTRRTPGGGRVTAPTAGPDGAYLAVLDNTPGNCPSPSGRCDGQAEMGTTLTAGAVVSVGYRGGASCQVPGWQRGACAPVGYVAPRASRVTTAEVAAPVTARVVRAHAFCARLSQLVPCNGRVPAGFTRVRPIDHQPLALIVVSFVARVAVTGSATYYEIHETLPGRDGTPGCAAAPGVSASGPTQTDLRAGEHTQFTQLVNPRCPGRSVIRVSYVGSTRTVGGGVVPGQPQARGVTVGRTSVRIP